jgi:hypothetical protein
MTQDKLLLTAVFGPYGVKDEYGEDLGCQMELLNNQITRQQGIHSPRQSYWSFGLYLMAENLSIETTVLDFPSWDEFKAELELGYTHVGISFIVPNVLKARRMAEYVREHYPQTKIIVGGYGTIIPDLDKIVPHDEVCRGEGVRWLRDYFGDDLDAPLRHPIIKGPASESIYGYEVKPKGGVLLPGLGCKNGCAFCITSHKFNKRYVPLLETGQDAFDVCRKAEAQDGTTGFSVMDENFLKQPQRARDLLDAMEADQKPYVFDLFSSAETIVELGTDFLVRMGVHLVWIGIESRSNSHGKIQGIDIAALIGELQAKGIVVQASSILFQDHHDRQTIQEDIDWVIGLESDLLQFMNYTPYPTTGLYRQLEEEGRLNDVHYRHHHGQGQLIFDHPHFPNPQDHVAILEGAFRQKFEAQGPGILNMAITAIEGYQRALVDHRERQRLGLNWNPETLRYEKSAAPQPDRFMELRLRKMQKIAMNIRVVLEATKVYAPNAEAREKAIKTIERFRQVLGEPTLIERAKSLALVATGAYESSRLAIHRARGHESIVRQPPSKRLVYPEDPSLRAAEPVRDHVAGRWVMSPVSGHDEGQPAGEHRPPVPPEMEALLQQVPPPAAPSAPAFME